MRRARKTAIKISPLRYEEEEGEEEERVWSSFIIHYNGVSSGFLFHSFLFAKSHKRKRSGWIGHDAEKSEKLRIDQNTF